MKMINNLVYTKIIKLQKRNPSNQKQNVYLYSTDTFTEMNTY